jgi:dolichyl-phosphate-mannose-protein mannosyltransferase
VKKRLARLYRREYFWLCVVVIATLAMHFSIIFNPNALVLDEAHYVGDARSIIQDSKDLRPEHPPLAKLFVVGGILALGDDPWGWRVPAIIMGTLSLILFYLICRKLNLSRRASSLAVFLFGFENFNFLMASVAMLDVFYLTLMMAFFALYLYRKHVWSGIFIGLTALAKLYGVMGAPVLLIHWLASRTKRSRWFALTVVLAPLSFVGLMPFFDFAISHQFLNPLARIKEMLDLSGSLTFANVVHPSLSRPWAWLLNYNPMPFWYSPHYTGAISLTVWAAMVPTVLFMLYRAFRRDDGGIFGFAWFFSTFLLWIPISIKTDRASYIYYFYPTIGSLCLGLGMLLNRVLEWAAERRAFTRRASQVGVYAFLALHLLAIVVLSPVFFRS